MFICIKSSSAENKFQILLGMLVTFNLFNTHINEKPESNQMLQQKLGLASGNTDDDICSPHGPSRGWVHTSPSLPPSGERFALLYKCQLTANYALQQQPSCSSCSLLQGISKGRESPKLTINYITRCPYHCPYNSQWATGAFHIQHTEKTYTGFLIAKFHLS